jgi:hypothetical protein
LADAHVQTVHDLPVRRCYVAEAFGHVMRYDVSRFSIAAFQCAACCSS